ncbi:uncharacterized protein [Malus domestica]|uniref:uncharacterized protein n=1 Tax=Malus domestica TaxID=3750 RepID=UPI0010A9E583|nr:uncharacterized protein LOC114819992 [Malus domestica]
MGSRDWGNILNCLEPMVSELMNADLIKPVSEEEIKAAVHQMGGLKAPGPDGFQGIFYHSFWDIIVAEVNGLVMDFMQGVGNSRSINSTYLVLIPKVPTPELVSQYRPISLCNFSFKILSKVLANRLQPLLPLLISPMQNVFIADRQIQENLGLAHELFHFLKLRKTKQKFEMCVKLDMQKAYDRVEWDFLEAVLLKLGFSRDWTNLVMNCVRTVKFAILLNGQPGKWFSPSRGIRQGDPLSPYLFLMVSDVLSRMIQRGVDDMRLNGIHMNPRGPCISHLFFADDTLICLQATQRNGENIMHILNQYCLASGQMMNLQKSSVYFGRNTPAQVRSQLGSLLGKEVLLKAVVQAIPTYHMNLFKFPVAVCKDLDSMSAGFLWGDCGGHRRIHWVNWDTLGRPKYEGGLGFRNFQDFNDALLVKQCWCLILNPNSLWAQTLKARYFLHSSFLDAKLGSRAFWAWASLPVGRDILKNGAHWQILNGKDTRLWVDRWLPSLPLGHPIPSSPTSVTLNTKVSSLICPSTKSWDIEFLRPFISEVELKAIYDIPLGNCSRRDRLIWTSSRLGNYSVRSGYHWIHSSWELTRAPASVVTSTLGTSFWKAIWHAKAPPKIRHFLWRAVSEALATVGGLFKRRSASSPMCPICKTQEESVLHLLLRCPWVEPIWYGGPLGLRRVGEGVSSYHHWLSVLINHTPNLQDRSRLLSVIAFSCWYIWKFDGMARLAAVLRDHNGLFVAAHKWSIGAPFVVFAEALAMLKGCELAAELGFRWIVAESDSLEVVSSLKGDIAQGSWEVFPILESILWLGNSFQGCRWSWVPRLAN